MIADKPGISLVVAKIALDFEKIMSNFQLFWAKDLVSVWSIRRCMSHTGLGEPFTNNIL